MERLIKNGDVILDGTLTRYQKEKQAFEKLEKLEDIEEELEIDLVTVFKALKEGAWFIGIKDNNPTFCAAPKLKYFYINTTLF